MINIAVVGYGRAGEAHARCWANMAGARIAGIVDPAPARQHAARVCFPTAKVVANLADLPDRAGLVLICTPPAYHELYIEEALAHSAHVFCEKPVFLNPSNGKRLLDLARSCDRTIHPGHNYLYSPALQHLHDLSTTEHIRRLKHLRMSVERTSPAAGTSDWNPAWRTDPHIAGGGILVDHGPHCIYLAEWLARQRIQQVTCVMSHVQHGVEDHVELDLALDGGATVHILLSWCAPQRTTRYEIIGERGRVALDGDRIEADTRLGRQTWRRPETPGTRHAHEDWLPAQAQDIIRRISAGTPDPAPARAALVVAKVIDAARRSSRIAGPATLL